LTLTTEFTENTKNNTEYYLCERSVFSVALWLFEGMRKRDSRRFIANRYVT